MSPRREPGCRSPPLAQILAWLQDSGYSGWVVIEEESEAVRPEPSAAIAANRRVLRALNY